MSLFEMTVSGGILILIITVIRVLAVNRLPKQTFLILWDVALLRLLIPFSVPFKLSIPAMVERAFVMGGAPTVLEMNEAVIHAAKQATRAVPDTPSPVWHILWLAGMIAVLLFFVIAYIRHLCIFRAAVPAVNNFTQGWLTGHPLIRPVAIRESGSITAPLTYGIFQPVILIPVGVDWEDAETLTYVFTHEYVHIRRFDALLRLALLGALCVHWFNPLVWAMYVLALRDIELSCDEAVVRELGLESRRAYALALLKMEETRQRFNAFVSSFSKNAAEERVRAILKCRRTSARRIAASVLVTVCVLCVCCVTSAGAAGYDALVESPGLIRMSAEELPGCDAGPHIWMQEGSFIKLRITGRGAGVFSFFFCCDRDDAVKGQQIPLDGGYHELWLEVPVDGYYYIRTLRNSQRPEGSDDYYTYTVYYTGYASDGELLGARYHRQNMFSGWWSTTYTCTVD